MPRTRFALSVSLILVASCFGQSAYAQNTRVVPPPPIVNSSVGNHQAKQDATDPEQAFDTTTGQNLFWDRDKKTWVDKKTGLPVSGGFEGPVVKESTTMIGVPVERSAPLAQIPQGLGSFGFGARYDGEFLHNMKFTKASQSLNGIVTNLNLSNPPKVSFKYNAGTVDIPIGLPTVHLFGDSSLYTAPVFIVGGAVYDTKGKSGRNGQTITYNGSGPMIGGGFGSTIMNPHCPFFAGLDVLYRDNLGVGVSPSPNSSGNASQSNTLSYYEWNVAARGGYSFATGVRFAPSVAPWAGVEFDSTNVKLTGSQNTPGQSSSYKNEVVANDFKGIAGLDARLCGQLFGRAQVSFNDTDYAVMAKLVYQFDLGNLLK